MRCPRPKNVRTSSGVRKWVESWKVSITPTLPLALARAKSDTSSMRVNQSLCAARNPFQSA